MNGILNLDKPAGISSAFAVNKIKWLLPKGTKVGHAGTLDPFATGVLLVLIGKATKLSEKMMDSPKQYLAGVRFGGTSPTDDPESNISPHPVATIPDQQTIESHLKNFIGEIDQLPPVYSALKQGGRPAYELARSGKPVELKLRKVKVYQINLIQYTWPDLTLQIDCGRGTYIRSIARDLGKALNVGGYLQTLRRTRVGDFYADVSVKIQELTRENIAASLQADN
jgi:tRNA pseudouridine55 synthase